MKALGIDIGGTTVKAGLVDAEGRVTNRLSFPTPTSLAGFRDALRAIPLKPVVGVGFGCKGLIDAATTRVESLPGTLSYLEGHRLDELLGTALPATADNDARAAMAGEMAWGAARGKSDALMLTLGTGVGGAVIAGGNLLRGANRVAGHIGHLTVNPDGPICLCGNRGCLETYFSARSIEAAAIDAMRRGVASSLLALDWRTVTCADVFDHARSGDALAGSIAAKATSALAAAIAGLLHVLDPEVVIVGGQITDAGHTLFAPLTAEIAWRTKVMIRRMPPIVKPGVSDATGVAGAAALIIRTLA